MYNIKLDIMNVIDFAVSRGVKELEAKGMPFSQKDIAAHIGCTEPTVNKSCQRLRAAGVIEMVCMRGRIFTYHYIGDVRGEFVSA